MIRPVKRDDSQFKLLILLALLDHRMDKVELRKNPQNTSVGKPFSYMMRVANSSADVTGRTNFPAEAPSRPIGRKNCEKNASTNAEPQNITISQEGGAEAG